MEKDAEKKTELEIKAAYAVATKLARKFMKHTHADIYRPHMDLEDFVQDGILAWLEGRPMYYAMLDSYRASSPLSRWDREVLGLVEPTATEFKDNISAEDVLSDIEVKIDSDKIIRRIQSIKDENVRFATLAYLYFGMSLREIGAVLGQSHESVRQNIILPEIKRLREEFNPC
ncbi:MAG: hypothetical protein ABIH23_05105 [bacterium]